MSKKRKSSSSSSCSSSSSSSSLFCPPKRREVTAKTVDKWILENDKTLNTATWLDYDLADRYHVAKLRCKVCTKFADELKGSRNFNAAFIQGSSNLRTTSFTDHAKTDLHEKRKTSTDVRSYAPIAVSLYRMDKVTEETLKKKFDLAYFIAN